MIAAAVIHDSLDPYLLNFIAAAFILVVARGRGSGDAAWLGDVLERRVVRECPVLGVGPLLGPEFKPFPGSKWRARLFPFDAASRRTPSQIFNVNAELLRPAASCSLGGCYQYSKQQPLCGRYSEAEPQHN